MSAVENQSDDDFELAVVADDREPWLESAWLDAARFGDVLREAGLPEEEISRQQQAREYTIRPILDRPSITEHGHGWWGRDPDAYEEVIRDEAERRHRDGVSALERLLRRIEVRVVDRASEAVRVPLFVLAAPPVAGSRVTFSESSVGWSSSSWGVTVFGTGMGADARLRLQSRGTFQAQDGARKLVFLPATLTVCRVGYYRAGQRVGEGVRTEIEDAGQVAGIETLDAAEPELNDDAEPIVYPLAGDPSGDIATYEIEAGFARTFHVELGVSAFKLATKVRATVYRERTATLKFELPSGVDYRFQYLRRPCGIWCIAPGAA